MRRRRTTSNLATSLLSFLAGIGGGCALLGPAPSDRAHRSRAQRGAGARSEFFVLTVVALGGLSAPTLNHVSPLAGALSALSRIALVLASDLVSHSHASSNGPTTPTADP